jgi:DNA-binding transcriptional LysR family regulator
MAELGLKRRVLLRVPHFMSVPLLVSESDMISTVPLTLGARFARNQGVVFVQPPVAIPSIPLKQFWHRRQQCDLGHSWFRELITREFVDRDPHDASLTYTSN